MNQENSDISSSLEDRLREALVVLAKIDQYRSLSTAAVIVLFFVSAGLAVRAFFLVIDLGMYVGLDKIDPVAPVTVSYVILFPVWALIFLGFMWGLDSLGVKNLRCMAEEGLSKLLLSPAELVALKTALDERDWKHGQEFKSALSTLIERRSGPAGDGFAGTAAG